MVMTTKIDGHRFGCPTRDEPMHQACVVADDGSILRRIDPSYSELRAENERLRAALTEMLESFTEPEDDNDILRRARAALGR